MSSVVAPPPPYCLGSGSPCTSSGASRGFGARLKAAAANTGSASVNLWPGNAAMAGVLSKDTPDIEVRALAPGWEDHGGAGGLGARPGKSR